MKKIIGLITLSALVGIAACNNESKPVETTKQAPAPAPVSAPVTTQTKVIVVHPAPTVIVKDPPAKGTTISLDKNGVKVETKKVAVDIKKDNK